MRDDVYLTRFNSIIEVPELPSRLKFMLGEGFFSLSRQVFLRIYNGEGAITSTSSLLVPLGSDPLAGVLKCVCGRMTQHQQRQT
jgi:hypothetical protein